MGYLPEFNILLMLRRRAFFIYFDYLPRDAFGKSSSGLAIEIVLNGAWRVADHLLQRGRDYFQSLDDS